MCCGQGERNENREEHWEQMHWDVPFYWCKAVTVMQNKRTCCSCHLDLFMAHLCCQSTRKQSAYVSWTDPRLRFECLEQAGGLDASGIKVFMHTLISQLIHTKSQNLIFRFLTIHLCAKKFKEASPCDVGDCNLWHF